MILALDPGTEKTAWVLYDAIGAPVVHSIDDNRDLHRWIAEAGCRSLEHSTPTRMVCEMVACYGMAVGREVFETCTWIGRFESAFGLDMCDRITRVEVKTRICHTPRAKDSNIRQALIDLYGGKERAVGTKKAPGPLYGVSTHVWAALAVAVAYRGKDLP